MTIRHVLAFAAGFLSACISITLGALLRGLNSGYR